MVGRSGQVFIGLGLGLLVFSLWPKSDREQGELMHYAAHVCTTLIGIAWVALASEFNLPKSP